MRPRAAAWSGVLVAVAAALFPPGGASGEQARSTPPPPAPSCRAPDDRTQVAALAAVIEGLRRSEARRTPGARRVESLDNRGHGYGQPGDSLADLPLLEPRSEP